VSEGSEQPGSRVREDEPSANQLSMTEGTPPPDLADLARVPATTANLPPVTPPAGPQPPDTPQETAQETPQETPKEAPKETPKEAPKEAIEGLMAAYGKAIYSLCLRVLRDPVAADEVSQQVFVDAYRGLAKFEHRSQPRTWLCGLAIHRCQDALRQKKRNVARHTADDNAVLVLEDPGRGPQAQLEQRELCAALEDCVAKLNEQIRMAVLLRFWLGMSYEDMACHFDMKADTLGKRVERALDTLRGCLRRKGWNCA
jgi:RNA polymerase sigma-70 factor (ECF subfamily)